MLTIKLSTQDLKSRELSLQKREQRISEDRELAEQRFTALSEDLHQAREELVTYFYIKASHLRLEHRAVLINILLRTFTNTY